LIDHTDLPAIRHKWTHLALTLAKGRYSIYLHSRLVTLPCEISFESLSLYIDYSPSAKYGLYIGYIQRIGRS